MQVLAKRLLALLCSCLLILVAPYRLEAAPSGTGGADLTPIEYSILKNFSAEFCEAIEDGVSVSSAYEIAMPAALWKSAGSIVGFVLSRIGQEEKTDEDEVPSTSDTEFQEMVLKKTQRCLTTAQSDELRTVLNDHGEPKETA